MTSTPENDEQAADDAVETVDAVADARLIDAHDLALAALYEITPAATVGAPAGYTLEEGGVVSLRFANTMPGYPNWFWTVSVAAVDGAEPTVLEAELLPGEGALLAPEWVPWAERLAEYQAAQAALAAEQGDAEASDEGDEDADEDDLDDDIDDIDAADFDEDGSPILHAGDVDGVDIDELDEDAEDAEEADAEDDDADSDAEDDDAEDADAEDDEDADSDDAHADQDATEGDDED